MMYTIVNAFMYYIFFGLYYADKLHKLEKKKQYRYVLSSLFGTRNMLFMVTRLVCNNTRVIIYLYIPPKINK